MSCFHINSKLDRLLSCNMEKNICDYRQGLSFREHLTQYFMSVVDTAMKAVMPPRRVRRAGRLVMRDDFNGASVDTSLWNYEVSMYGGYVRIVLF